ncbi:hypothetical protein RQP46_002508 [Phenoliferia psychrophenolica]
MQFNKGTAKKDSEDERIAARSVQPIFKLTNPAPSSTSTTPKPPPPTTSKPPPTPSSKARAARRVTITLSSDSEDSSDADSPLFPPSTPRAGPSLHQHQHKHVEAISICGNSDDEDEDGSDGNDTVALDPRDDFADDGFGFEFEDSGVLVYNPPRSSKPTRLAPSVVVSSAPTPTPTRAPLASMSNTIDLTNSDSDDDGGPTPNGLSSGPSGSGPGLPDGIEIRWNNRLLNTAGRAIWKKVRNGPETKHQLAIELSTKVTDTADKLLHTLAHELCHIAAWILSGEMKPDHGPAFKLWAKRVTIMRPEIHITTTHSYKIAYKFSWRCDRTVCGKTFGRHSNSINPKTQGCPCGGRLSPIDSLGNVKTPAKKSAYQLYVSEMTPVLRRENPGTTQAQIFKIEGLAAEGLDFLEAVLDALPSPPTLRHLLLEGTDRPFAEDVQRIMEHNALDSLVCLEFEGCVEDSDDEDSDDEDSDDEEQSMAGMLRDVQRTLLERGVTVLIHGN